jgi:hypothetical protein
MGCPQQLLHCCISSHAGKEAELSYRASEVIEPFVMGKQIVLIVYDTIELMRDEIIVSVEIGVIEGKHFEANV